MACNLSRRTLPLINKGIWLCLPNLDVYRYPCGRNYPVIRRLLRILYHGKEAKKDVDIAIDVCGAVHNVRTAVLETRMQMEVASDDNTALLYARK